MQKNPRRNTSGGLLQNHFFFSHPDFTVGSGISPDQPLHTLTQRVADFTAGWELHPAPKNLLMQFIVIILRSEALVKIYVRHFPAFFRQAIGNKPQEAVALT